MVGAGWTMTGAGAAGGMIVTLLDVRLTLVVPGVILVRDC